ncbi:hypothetical protein ACFXAO_16000 [Streptomyces lavendulae]|uniref:hypothetical protein n=1 Tax=Streptomyces lavendulae TaxID=1914 RepID=UPI0036C36E49
MSDTPIAKTKLPNVSFKEPLFHAERISADWQNMRSQITSATQLEAAYRVIEPQIENLAPELSDEDRKQVLALYNSTVTDGRYLKDLLADPADVAAKLGLNISKAGETAIKRAGRLPAIRDLPEEALLPLVGVVAIVAVPVIVIVIVVDPVKEPAVIDESGIVKL